MSDEKFECEVMSWDRFYSLSTVVARKIINQGYSPDFIVGLARGGWVLSRVLCDFLGVKDLVSLKVEHWGVTATPDGKAQLKYPFKIDLDGKKVLIVDDITDTGESMSVALDYVLSLNPEEVKTANLMHITGSKFIPDFFGEEISWRWVIFPWNYIEDMCNIIQKISREEVEPRKILKKLKEDHKIETNEEEVTRILNEIRRRSKK